MGNDEQGFVVGADADLQGMVGQYVYNEASFMDGAKISLAFVSTGLTAR